MGIVNHTCYIHRCIHTAANSQLPPSVIVVHRVMFTECVWNRDSGLVCRRVGDVALTLEPSQPLLNQFSHRAKATRTRSAVGCEVTAM